MESKDLICYMEALRPVSAQASSSTSSFVFAIHQDGRVCNVAGENSKNALTPTKETSNIRTDSEGDKSPTQDNDDFSGNTDGGRFSTGFCSAGGRTTDTSQARQSKQSKKGLHSTQAKSKGLKRTLTHKKTTKRKAGTSKYSGKRKRQRRVFLL